MLFSTGPEVVHHCELFHLAAPEGSRVDGREDLFLGARLIVWFRSRPSRPNRSSTTVVRPALADPTIRSPRSPTAPTAPASRSRTPGQQPPAKERFT
jgi:hypothetical protein